MPHILTQKSISWPKSYMQSWNMFRKKHDIEVKWFLFTKATVLLPTFEVETLKSLIMYEGHMYIITNQFSTQEPEHWRVIICYIWPIFRVSTFEVVNVKSLNSEGHHHEEIVEITKYF